MTRPIYPMPPVAEKDKINLDATALESILACPGEYSFSLDTPSTSIHQAAFLGSTLHLAMSYYYELTMAGDRLDAVDVVDMFNDSWTKRDAAVDRSGNRLNINWAGEDAPTVQKMGQELVKMYVEKVAVKTKPILVEKDFQRTYPWGTLFGRIDIVGEDWVPIDIKTAIRPPQQVRLDRAMQPFIYLLGLRELGLPESKIDTSTKFIYHHLIKSKVPDVRTYTTYRSTSDLDWFETMFLPSVADAVRRGRVVDGDRPNLMYNPQSWLCSDRWCNHWGKCRGAFR